MFSETRLKILRDPGVVNILVCFANENVSVEDLSIGWPAKRSLWSVARKVQNRASLRISAPLQSEGWARLDSNQGPRDYESPALTAELQARETPRELNIANRE